MINEEFTNAAKVHTKILIYEHAELRWSHEPQAQHLVPASDTSVSLSRTPATAHPSSPSVLRGWRSPWTTARQLPGGPSFSGCCLLCQLLPPSAPRCRQPGQREALSLCSEGCSPHPEQITLRWCFSLTLCFS